MGRDVTEEPIIKVWLDEHGRLFVQPAEMQFEFIYRTAAGINWDARQRALFNSELRDWSPVQWFEQILKAAASEYNVALRTGPLTKWAGLTPRLQAEIELLSDSDWIEPLLSQRKRKGAEALRNLLLSQALDKAARLFEQAKYADYASVLEPYRDQLSPAQLKRLSLAERRARDAE